MRFNRLPNEIKSDVFVTFSAQQLCSIVAPVCREWRQFAYSSIYWTNVDMPKGKQATTLRIKNILQHCFRVRQLTVRSVRDFAQILDIPIHPSLRELKLSFCSLSAEQIPRLTTTFPYVQKLILTECLHVTNDVINNFTHWDYLTEINLESPITGDENQFLDIVSTNCKNLEQFSTKTLYYLNDRSFSNFLIQLGPQLTVLRISGLTNVTTNAYSFLTHCRRVIDLTLLETQNFTKADFLTITELSKLEYLTIYGSDLLFTEALGNSLTGLSLPQVKKLVIKDCANMRRIDLVTLIKSFSRTMSYLAVTPNYDLQDRHCRDIAFNHGFQMHSMQRFSHPGDIFVMRR